MRSTPRPHSRASGLDREQGRQPSTASGGGSDGVPRSASATARVATILAFVGATTFVVSLVSRHDREPPNLPEGERRVLYGRILETLRSTCTQTSEPDVIAYCRHEAAFVERLPECGTDCHALASRFSELPSR